MGRPTSKNEMLEAADVGFKNLWTLIDSMSDKVLHIEFDFSHDLKKKEAHWKRDKNLRDVLTHLYEWHQLFLKWVRSNRSGNKSAFLPSPYTWKTYGEMNMELWKKHQKTSLKESKELLKKSHEAVRSIISGFSDEELFTKKHFDWTGTTSLGSYGISAMSSHYDWAVKKLRAHVKRIDSL